MGVLDLLKANGQRRYPEPEESGKRQVRYADPLKGADSANDRAIARIRREQEKSQAMDAQPAPAVDPQFMLYEQFPELAAARSERAKWGTLRREQQERVDRLQLAFVERRIGKQHRYGDATESRQTLPPVEKDDHADAIGKLLRDPSAEIPDTFGDDEEKRIDAAKRRLALIQECERIRIHEHKLLKERCSVEMNRRFMAAHANAVRAIARAVLPLIDASIIESTLRTNIHSGGAELFAHILPSMSFPTASLHIWLNTAQQLGYVNIEELRAEKNEEIEIKALELLNAKLAERPVAS